MRDDTFGESPQTFRPAEIGAGGQDHFQPAPIGFELVNLPVRADGDGQAGEQADTREFGLGLVVVDVVGADGIDLGSVAGLAGPQDDAQRAVAEFFAHMPDQLQARVGRFHHHVQQHDRQIGVLGQARARFLRRIGVDELDLPSLDTDFLQGEFRGPMDIGLVVHDQDSPSRFSAALGFLRFAEKRH